MSKFFDKHGNFIGTIPEECVEDCTVPGQDASEALTYWVNKLGFKVPTEMGMAYLEEYDVSLDPAGVGLDETVLWLACGDIQDTGEWFGLVH